MSSYRFAVRATSIATATKMHANSQIGIQTPLRLPTCPMLCSTCCVNFVRAPRSELATGYAALAGACIGEIHVDLSDKGAPRAMQQSPAAPGLSSRGYALPQQLQIQRAVERLTGALRLPQGLAEAFENFMRCGVLVI